MKIDGTPEEIARFILALVNANKTESKQQAGTHGIQKAGILYPPDYYGESKSSHTPGNQGPPGDGTDYVLNRTE